MRRIILTALVVVFGTLGWFTVAAASSAHGTTHPITSVSPLFAAGSLQEAGGGSLYLTTDGTGDLAKVETGNGPGRTLTFTATGGTWYAAGDCALGCPIYQMAVSTGYCVGADNALLYMELRQCAQNSTYWAYDNGCTGCQYQTEVNTELWINTRAALILGGPGEMTGSTVVGDAMWVCTANGFGCAGENVKWERV